jgi:hypothetical protein
LLLKKSYGAGHGCPCSSVWVDGSPEASLAVLVAVRASLDLAVQHLSFSGLDLGFNFECPPVLRWVYFGEVEADPGH